MSNINQFDQTLAAQCLLKLIHFYSTFFQAVDFSMLAGAQDAFMPLSSLGAVRHDCNPVIISVKIRQCILANPLPFHCTH